MRSVHFITGLVAVLGLAALSGCLVSDEPMLDASNGAATPLAPGAYVMCEHDGGSDAGACDDFSITHDATGLYLFEKDDEDPVEMRFRKIGRRGFAVQTEEDDGYMYYYGAGDTERFGLVMMQCADLPERMRGRMIAAGDLETDDEDFETCTVKTLKGLTRAAKAYHRGRTTSEESAVMEFTPAPPAGGANE